jgi:uncharacterized protein (DUF3820 family)
MSDFKNTKMTDQNEIKLSYTSQLKEHLKDNKLPKKCLDMISVFALEYSSKMEEERKVNAGVINFGKYKGKKIEDVFNLDKPYVMWLQKNNKYLNSENKEIVSALLT